MSAAQRKRLHQLEERLRRLEKEVRQTQAEWSALTREAGQSAVARELGIPRQTVSERVRRWGKLKK